MGRSAARDPGSPRVRLALSAHSKVGSGLGRRRAPHPRPMAGSPRPARPTLPC